MDEYAALWCKSNFSFLEGASHAEELVEEAHRIGIRSIALTDRDGVYGAVRFVKACMRSGIRPILGVDLAVEPSGLTRRPSPARPGSSRVAPARGGSYRDPAGGLLPRVTVLAGSKAGSR